MAPRSTGIFGMDEAARLLGITPRQLRSWAHPTTTRDAVLAPSLEWAYSFEDLVSLAVIRAMREKGVSACGIIEAQKELTAETGRRRPFAYQDVIDRLRTCGDSVISYDDAVDLSARGQYLFLEAVEAYLLPIDYGSDLRAERWRPAPGVTLDPEIQVGHPCIEGTRVMTEVVADRRASGEGELLVADDLGVTVQQIRAAVAFEEGLRMAGGMLAA